MSEEFEHDRSCEGADCGCLEREDIDRRPLEPITFVAPNRPSSLQGRAVTCRDGMAP